MSDDALRAAQETIARNVAAERAAKGFSQNGLAVEAGLTQQKISAIEKASDNLTLGTITKVAVALGVEVSALLKS